jgi:hypothetical protein
MYAETAALSCATALGFNVSTLGVESLTSILDIKLEHFQTHFENAMQNPPPVADPKFAGGTLGACLAMMSYAEFDEGDNVEEFGGPYVDAIIEHVLNNAEVQPAMKEHGVRALGKLGPFLDADHKRIVMNTLILILADVSSPTSDNRPVRETGIAIGKILPALGWIPRSLSPTMRDVAIHARAKNNAMSEMQAVAFAMEGFAKSDVQDILRIMKAAANDGGRLRKHEHNYLSDVYEQAMAIWPGQP